MAERRVDEVLVELLRREVAALAALGEAMDASLANDGLIGRRDEPRRMIELRLRLNEKLRRTLDRYEMTLSLTETEKFAAALDEFGAAPSRSLAEEIVEMPGRKPEERLAPDHFDAEVFLFAVIVTDDPMTNQSDRLRARRMLTKRRRAQPITCTCIATLRSRDAIEFRSWIDDLRGAGGEPWPGDNDLAARFRAIARGDLSKAGYYHETRRTIEALQAVVAAATTAEAGRARPQRLAPDEKPFWITLVSRSPRTRTKDRLDAFVALDDLEVLPRCQCDPQHENELIERQPDAWDTYVVRMCAETHYRAALIVAAYPETYLAVRDAIDDALLAEDTAEQTTTAA